MTKSKPKASRRPIHCSFCGRSRKEARIIVGAEGMICEVCAERTYNFFFPDGKKGARKGSRRDN
jgi:hypothetical protein